MKLALHWQILIAVVLGVLVAPWLGEHARLLDAVDVVGTLFLNALKMLAIPLIFASIVAALLGLPAGGALRRLGLGAAAYYLLTSFLAIVTGLVIINLFTPGIEDGHAIGERLGLAANTHEVVAGMQTQAATVGEFLRRLIPANVFASAASGDMLGIVVFALLFGGAGLGMSGKLLEGQQRFWEGINAAMLRLANGLMRVAPIGVFALVAKVLAVTGLAALLPLLGFAGCVLLGLAFHVFVTLPLLLKFVGGVSPFAHFRGMSPALLTAFSTDSSSATLPVTLECVEKNCGVRARTAGFVLPLGATINMDGTALYECAAALFIAQAYGVELSLGAQFTVVALALATSVGVAGIPAASLVAIAVILGAVGLPLEGIGLILAVDRILDMTRTAVNVYSDSCGAAIIDKRLGAAPGEAHA